MAREPIQALRARNEALQVELDELRLRLDEAVLALEAIRTGEAESLVVEGPDGPRIFSLEGSDHSYRVLVEAMHEGAATLSEGGVILYCNGQFASLLGTPLERTIGSSIYDHVAPRCRPACETLLQRAGVSDVREEITLCDEAGAEIPAHLSISLFAADGRRTYCLVATDLREQRRSEAQERVLSEELRLQATIATHLSEGIYLIRAADAIIVYANPRFEQMFGYAKGELIGKHISVLAPACLSPEQHADDIEARLKSSGIWEGEIENVKKDGARLWCHASVSSFDHPRFGSVWVSVHSDISERMRLEHDRAAAFEERETLLREIHHRVKNNLQVISSLFYLQSQRTEQKSLRALLDESRSRIQSIALIHEKLYQSERLAWIDFGDYLKDLTRTLTRAIGVQAPHVKVQIAASEVFLDIDHAIPCALIVNELVSNALKHAFPAGRSGEIRVGVVRDPPSMLRLVVSDSGVGFPEQLDFTDAATLGMQLVCSLTRQLRGTVELRRGAGTCFEIQFPAAPPGGSPVHSMRPGVERRHGGPSADDPARFWPGSRPVR